MPGNSWWRRRWRGFLDWFDVDTSHGRNRITLLLLLAAAVLTVLGATLDVRVIPPSTLVVPLVAGGLLLDPWRLRTVTAACLIGLVVLIATQGLTAVRPATLVVSVIVSAIALVLARDRERLGLSVGRGESMLLELRDSLESQGLPPVLPPAWHADVARRPAGGGAFGGDFLVAGLAADGGSLEMALVDVSGKGIDAGTRSLLLSGAFGGLLGSVPPERFLTFANSYVFRQDWLEGFATCVHVSVDLTSGAFRVANAGHPPVAHLAAGSGRWTLLDIPGMALGLDRSATFGEMTGVLKPDDALLLYTDGLVEVPGRDLEDGIDRLLGAAERMVSRGPTRNAQELMDAVAAVGYDDRALVLLWRGD